MTAAALILAVEDDARNAALLQAVLGGAGYRLELATSLAEARAWLAQQSPDLVLLDIGLPDGSGLTLARELRAAPTTSEVPIVVTSARVLAKDRHLADEAGSNLFMPKPLRPSALLESVADWLARPRRPSITQ